MTALPQQGKSDTARWSHTAAILLVVCGTLCDLSLLAPALSTLPLAHAQPGGLNLDDLFGDKNAAPAPPAKPVFTVSMTPATAAVGDEVTLSIQVQVAEGFYIYGTGGNFGGRTRIETKEQFLTPLDEQFVPDRPEELHAEPLFKAELSKFVGGITWSRRYRVEAGGEPQVSGTLTGQYCSDAANGSGLCVPIRPPFEFTQTVALKPGDATPAPTAAGDPGPAPAAEPTPTVDPGRFIKTMVPRYGAQTPIRWTAALMPQSASVGNTVTLSVTADIEPGWHTFSTTQKGLGGSPTELELDELVGLAPLTEDWTPASPPKLEQPLPDTTLETYYGQATWTRTFRVESANYGVAGSVLFQLCDESVCKAPKRVKYQLGAEAPADTAADANPATPPTTNAANTEPPATRQGNAGPESTPAPSGSGAGSPPVATPTADAASSTVDSVPAVAVPAGPPAPALGAEGLLPFLLTAVAFGYFSLLTPCAFPMVPVTVSFFLKQSEKSDRNPVMLALFYCAAIVLTFTVLGVGVSFLFGATGLNRLANNSWFNLVIGLVFVAFALNMLGMFEIRVPSWLLNLTSTGEAAGGYVGAAFMALTFTLTSFTCTFAFAGSVLIAASKGEIYMPVLGMLAFGAAFASPFLLLALVPSLLKQLPKSGGWMNTVKVVMGLVELAAAIKFFSVADQSWNPTSPLLFDFVNVMLAWTVIAFLIGAYLLGWFRFQHDTPIESISVPRGLFAGSFLGFAGFLAMGLIQPAHEGGWLMHKLLAFAPPRFHINAPEPAGPVRHTDASTGLMANFAGPTITHGGIVFSLDFEKAAQHAQQQQAPLFLDFTGINCVNCREMELKMAQRDWRERLAKFVGVQLYVDTVDTIPTVTDAEYARRLYQTNLELQEKLTRDVTMPYYAVVSSDGKSVYATYSGSERSPGEFLQFLDSAYRQWEAARTQTAGQAR